MRKKAPEGENKERRFERLATARTNTILVRLRVLGNCGNRGVYSYTREDVDRIFDAIEKQTQEARAKFSFSESRREKFHL